VGYVQRGSGCRMLYACTVLSYCMKKHITSAVSHLTVLNMAVLGSCWSGSYLHYHTAVPCAARCRESKAQ
jgi:hypothetical protein